MKRLIWFFSILPFFLNGQIYEIKYAKPHKSLAGDGSVVFQESYTLYLEQGKSLFVVHATEGYQEMNEESFQFTAVLEGGDRWYYKEFKDRKLTAYEYTALDNHYLIEDELHPMQWKIEAEKKIIGGFECQKATCDFRGRSYEAWFTMDIPIGNGPWKLGGLPGLIIEAFDKEKRLVFLFQSIKQIKDTGFKIEMPTVANPQKVSLKDFYKYFKEDTDTYFKRFEAKLQRSVGANGGTASVKIKGYDLLEFIE